MINKKKREKEEEDLPSSFKASQTNERCLWKQGWLGQSDGSFPIDDYNTYPASFAFFPFTLRSCYCHCYCCCCCCCCCWLSSCSWRLNASLVIFCLTQTLFVHEELGRGSLMLMAWFSWFGESFKVFSTHGKRFLSNFNQGYFKERKK